MAWLLTDYGKSRLGLPGVPWRDMTDDEFAEAEELFPEIGERGYFAREEVATERERQALTKSWADARGPGAVEPRARSRR